MTTSDDSNATEQISLHRSRIDEIDCQIVRLLNERAAESLAIRELKPQVQMGLYDPKREEEIFINVTKCNTGPLYTENLREIYESILHVMKELRDR
ncbi:MAG: chorismate mutase [Actinobacteria bacterium]|nr:chorismate mutase [Actinomycetota bacterium]MCL5887119.1 chorismate mutase [Actinomycetota bacterium]